MKQRKNLLQYSIKIICILVVIYFNTSRLYADQDTSLRTDLNFFYTFNKQFQSVSYVFLQADDNIANYDYVEWGTGLQYQTSLSWLAFLVYYQQGFSKNEPGNWLLEQRPSINMNTSTTLFSFKISNQIRYEERFAQDWHDYRIKNTLQVSRSDLFLQPYICWELYYENRDKAVMLNRIKLGIIKDISSHVSVGPYYRIDFSNNNYQWEWTRQLIGFQMTIKY